MFCIREVMSTQEFKLLILVCTGQSFELNNVCIIIDLGFLLDEGRGSMWFEEFLRTILL